MSHKVRNRHIIIFCIITKNSQTNTHTNKQTSKEKNEIADIADGVRPRGTIGYLLRYLI